MAFAIRLANLEATPEQCPPLVEDPKYKANYEKIKALLAPPVKEVVLKSPKKVVKIGWFFLYFIHVYSVA